MHPPCCCIPPKQLNQLSFVQTANQYYHYGRFELAGGVLPGAVTAYRTHGVPKNDKVIVFPTSFGPAPYGDPYLPFMSYKDNMLTKNTLHVAHVVELGDDSIGT
ncbi:hypothetical protein DFJ58DRAFT_854075 [Suillus subalutaceus]|uniref:uncharacterized protein n=1 Tax=Suillus subalutaceus TaxID=48586 RepID=UPI001B87306D|nr:uncharacterized protein DFJ58DRAFT_854075 [Suillus subalutaceus]KAG1870161.1 hypothetical protein DFJ58DRAFT_854075 [Suillus subalutaceus]